MGGPKYLTSKHVRRCRGTFLLVLNKHGQPRGTDAPPLPLD